MRLSTYFLMVPVALLAAAMAVANREIVAFSLDPFSDVHPALVLEMPLYLLLFFTLIIGVVLGGAVALMGRRAKGKTLPGREAVQSKALARIDAREKTKEAA